MHVILKQNLMSDLKHSYLNWELRIIFSFTYIEIKFDPSGIVSQSVNKNVV